MKSDNSNDPLRTVEDTIKKHKVYHGEDKELRTVEDTIKNIMCIAERIKNSNPCQQNYKSLNLRNGKKESTGMRKVDTSSMVQQF